MNEEHDGMSHMVEQLAAFQKIWGETFGKLMQLGFTFSPESAPPEFLRQMRSGIFEALGQSWEHFLRSPQFMEGTKQQMDQAIAFRKMSNDFYTKVRHETQAASRDDIDAVMLAVRHMETRILDRIEKMAVQMDGAGKRPAKPNEKKSPPPPQPGRGPKGKRAATSPRRK